MNCYTTKLLQQIIWKFLVVCVLFITKNTAETNLELVQQSQFLLAIHLVKRDGVYKILKQGNFWLLEMLSSAKPSSLITTNLWYLHLSLKISLLCLVLLKSKMQNYWLQRTLHQYLLCKIRMMTPPLMLLICLPQLWAPSLKLITLQKLTTLQKPRTLQNLTTLHKPTTLQNLTTL